MEKNKKYAIMVIAIFAVILVAGIYLTNHLGKTTRERSAEKSEKELSRLLRNIDVTDVQAQKATITDSKTSLADELPDIEKYPLVVEGNGEINVEIISSTEKSGTGTDGWLTEMARSFNAKNYKVDEKRVSVSVRSIASGLATDYLASEKYKADAFTPSNTLWGEMVKSNNIKVEKITDKLVGNVAGIVMQKSKYDNLVSKYGEANLSSIIKATLAGDITLGYTNPYASSAGMNFLVSTLAYFDKENPTSDTAVEGFKKLQEKVPFVAYTTLQMRDSAEKGKLDAFILEYQTYVNDDTFSKNYQFIPYGVEHNNPLYSIGNLEEGKKQTLEQFADYCKQQEATELAQKYGFNRYTDYHSEQKDYDGKVLYHAQDIWKEEKDLGRPVIGVFVADISGSMDGTPLSELKSSLINASKYINSRNYVGLVSYNSKVYRNLEINQFDLNQRAYFNGAIQGLSAGGSTATYDAVLVALDMVNKKLREVPDAKPMIFVLSDGETNKGNSLSRISNIVEDLQVPMYTIGYNANLEELGKLSSINEAASINADSDDVVYQLKNLFNSNL